MKIPKGWRKMRVGERLTSKDGWILGSQNIEPICALNLGARILQGDCEYNMACFIRKKENKPRKPRKTYGQIARESFDAMRVQSSYDKSWQRAAKAVINAYRRRNAK